MKNPSLDHEQPAHQWNYLYTYMFLASSRCNLSPLHLLPLYVPLLHVISLGTHLKAHIQTAFCSEIHRGSLGIAFATVLETFFLEKSLFVSTIATTTLEYLAISWADFMESFFGWIWKLKGREKFDILCIFVIFNLRYSIFFLYDLNFTMNYYIFQLFCIISIFYY